MPENNNTQPPSPTSSSPLPSSQKAPEQTISNLNSNHYKNDLAANLFRAPEPPAPLSFDDIYSNPVADTSNITEAPNTFDSHTKVNQMLSSHFASQKNGDVSNKQLRTTLRTSNVGPSSGTISPTLGENDLDLPKSESQVPLSLSFPVDDVMLSLEDSTLSGLQHFVSSSRFVIEKDKSGNVQIIDRVKGTIVDATPKLKLEVIRAETIKRLFRISLVAYAMAFIWLIVLVILANTEYKTTVYTRQFTCANGSTVLECQYDTIPTIPEGCSLTNEQSDKAYNFTEPYAVMNNAMDIMLFIYSVMLTVWYFWHLFQISFKSVLPEQFLVIFLLIFTSLFLIPYTAILQILDRAGKLPESVANNRFFYLYVSLIFQSFFTLISYLYIWIGAGLYKFSISKIPWTFYAFKVTGVSGLVAIVAVCTRVLNFNFGYPPPSTFINMIVYTINVKTDTAIIVSSVVITCYELLLILLILYEFFVTKKVLDKQDFLQTRSKQVGYRAFSSFTLFHYIIWIPTIIICLSAYPQGDDICSAHVRDSFYNNYPSWFTWEIMTLTYTTVQTYLHVPYSSMGILASISKCIWSHREKKQDHHRDEEDPSKIIEQRSALDRRSVNTDFVLSYKKKEPEGFYYDATQWTGCCFILQHHVRLFNFAWLAYSFGKRMAFNPKDFAQWTCSPIEIIDVETDTRVMVNSLPDSIVVAFKGTTSLKNVSTDMQFSFMKLDQVVELSNDKYEQFRPSWIHFEYRLARVHKGFAVAYLSVAKRVQDAVASFYAEQPRPLYFTGHSLGGALATLCSLDASINYSFVKNINREIIVSTFGSPRVGNRLFRRIYNDIVPTHWRILMQSDLITSVPKLGYIHVGRKVLLTPRGLLFIDPSGLEGAIWHVERKDFKWHKKSSYLLAIRTWCHKQHRTTYEPEFWPWNLEDASLENFSNLSLSEASDYPMDGIGNSIIGSFKSSGLVLTSKEAEKIFKDILDE